MSKTGRPPMVLLKAGLPTLFFLGVFSTDALIKPWVRNHLQAGLHGSLTLGGFSVPGLGLHWVENTGVAFSLLHGAPSWGLALGALGLMLGLLGWAWLVLPRSTTFFGVFPWLAVALVLAGGCNNALERLLKGTVTDYLEFTWFAYPTFNLSDVAVVTGTTLLAIWLSFCANSPKN